MNGYVARISVTDECAAAIILKPSPVEKVPRNEADEVSWRKSNKKPLLEERWTRMRTERCS